MDYKTFSERFKEELEIAWSDSDSFNKFVQYESKSETSFFETITKYLFQIENIGRRRIKDKDIQSLAIYHALCMKFSYLAGVESGTRDISRLLE